MIVEVLKQKATLHENIRVISNDMNFKNVSYVFLPENVHIFVILGQAV